METLCPWKARKNQPITSPRAWVATGQREALPRFSQAQDTSIYAPTIAVGVVRAVVEYWFKYIKRRWAVVALFFIPCGGSVFEADRVPREGRSRRRRPSFILFLKTVFSYILGSVQATWRCRRSDQPAQWTGRGKPGEEDDKPPSLSSLAPSLGPTKAPSSLVTAHTHTHKHTHYPVTILSQTHLRPQTDLKIKTTPPSRLSVWPPVRPSRLCSPLARPFPLIHPSAKIQGSSVQFVKLS